MVESKNEENQERMLLMLPLFVLRVEVILAKRTQIVAIINPLRFLIL